MTSLVKAFVLFYLFALPFWAGGEPRAALDLSGLEAYVEQALRTSGVPGAAVAVIKDGQVILARGFGLRDREVGLPVTEHTLFAIGSTTKAMTATAVMMLHQDGLLNVRKPVAEYLPDFRLQDPTATAQTNLIDMLSHRTGLPRHDAAWYGGDDLPRNELWQRMRHFGFSAGFREVWQYNNFMYMAAGHIVERLTGRTWEEFVRERIFTPLGMNESNFSVVDTEAAPDFARPYSARATPTPEKVPMRAIIGMGPAGSVNSNLVDMTKWLQFNIDRGVVAGQSLLIGDLMDFMHRPQMILPKDSFDFAELSYPNYALGWMTQQFRGRNLVWHNGGIDGFLSFVGYMPDERLGVIVFQNSDHKNIINGIALRAFDEVLGGTSEDWIARFDAIPKPAPPTPTYARGPLARSLVDYVGTFAHPAYGDVVLSVLNGTELHLRFNGMDFLMEHLNNGVFKLRNSMYPDADSIEPVYFVTDVTGAITQLRAKLEQSVAPIEFNRR